MQNLFLYCFSIFFFFFFSCTTQQVAYSKPFHFHTNKNRRILHEPFVPFNTLSPSQPPKPPPQQPKPPLSSYSSTSTSNTKHPFSTTITTPNNNNNNNNNPNQEQSPFFPNYPPLSPPPPPASPITFASFPANISSLVIPHTTQPTSSSNKLLPITVTAVCIAVAVVFAIFTFVYFRRRYRNRRAADNKSLRSDSSIELFPRNDETVAVAGTGSEFLYLGTVVNSRRIDDTQRGGVLDSRKLESPELRPLPPLARFPEPPLPPSQGGGGCSEEEDEEFYSPRGSSLGGLESSGGTGSCSQQAFSTVAARRSGESSSISCSSSSFGSPEHSHSISLSPPASSSPPRTHSKSPETTPSHSVSTFSSQQHVQSSSQERVLEKNEDVLSARVSNASNGSVKSIISSSSAFSLPSSPEKVTTMHHHSTFDQSPRISSVSEGLKIPGLSSMPLSPSLLSSPEVERGGFNYTSNYAATVPHRKLWEIPIAPVPPPPPPLPPQRQRRHWGMPASSIPVGQSQQQVLRPPELVPPSRPFVLQNTTINEGLGEIEETSKLKLKPLHWDKVRTSSDREMVWDHLKSSSFK